MQSTASSIAYTPYYCEENAFHLVQSQALTSLEPAMLFWFAPNSAVALTHQKNAPPQTTIYWDYHVMVYAAGNDTIYDLDCRLGMPLSRQNYLSHCVPSSATKPETYCRMVNKADATKYFGSDRKHMLGVAGNYLAPPPKSAAIRPDSQTFYPSWIHKESNAPGVVLSVKEFELSSAVDLRTRLKDRYTEA